MMNYSRLVSLIMNKVKAVDIGTMPQQIFLLRKEYIPEPIEPLRRLILVQYGRKTAGRKLSQGKAR